MRNESIERIISIAQKEKFHILRDPYALAIAIVVPLFIVLVFGFVIDFDVKDIPIAYQDQSQSTQSRDFLQKLDNSGYFKIKEKLYSTEDAFKEIENSNVLLNNIYIEKMIQINEVFYRHGQRQHHVTGKKTLKKIMKHYSIQKLFYYLNFLLMLREKIYFLLYF